MKIAIVHDDLVQWGGAERILQGICEVYPDAPIYTSVFDKDNKELVKRFGSKKIYTSFLQKIPGWKSLYKALLPFYPIAFEQFNLDRFDVVISHTTRFAKGIITKPGTTHICYCHTPPRFLWRFSGDRGYRLGEVLMSKLRIYDRVSSQRVDYFLAGSENARQRIKKIYKKNSKVVYPFIDTDRFQEFESFDGDYFVVISRLNKYKRVDMAIKACQKIGANLKIIGNGPDINNLKEMAADSNVQFLGNISDEMVVTVLSGATALIIPGIEDFGLTSLEAQALGKPVIAYKEGGVLETITDGKTGIFFHKQSEADLAAALSKIKLLKINPEDCKNNVLKFDKLIFYKDFKQAIDDML